jgi:hypothetical protein
VNIFGPYPDDNMTSPSSLVLYRSSPIFSLIARPSTTSMISSHIFNHQTGTAIITELLYRLLFDIINRFLASFQRLASRGMEDAYSWLEWKLQERQQAKDRATQRLTIVEEVGKMAEQRGFITCPMGGEIGAKRQPPWMKSVLKGIKEGRLHDRDFYTNSW